jgi:hypothetical protein
VQVQRVPYRGIFHVSNVVEHTAILIIIEPVDWSDVGHLLPEVLLSDFYDLRPTNMLAIRNRVNTYDFRCKIIFLSLKSSTKYGFQTLK